MWLNKFKKLNIFLGLSCLTVLIIVGVNLLANKFFYRFDLTENKTYSLSKESVTTVQSLKDPIEIRVYFSKDLPPDLAAVKDQVANLLGEYGSYNKNLRIKYIDPGDGEKPAKDGVPKLRLNDVRKDKFEVMDGYMGLVIEKDKKKEIIPYIENISDLEYRVTLAIKKVSVLKLKRVGLVYSRGSESLKLNTLIGELNKIYDVKPFDFDKDNIKNFDLLIITVPKENFSATELKQLDNFLLNDKSIIVLFDRYNVSANLVATENQTNLEAWLDKYGFKMGKELVLDSISGSASFNQGFFSFDTAYPYWLKITKDRFNSTNPALMGLDGVITPWAISVDNPAGEIIFKTSPDAWLVSGSFPLLPENIPYRTNSGVKSLGVILSKATSSALGDKLSDNSNLIVLGDADFIKDEYVSKDRANLVLMQNLVDYSLLDNSYANIRVKNISFRPIKELKDFDRKLVRYVNLFGVSVIVVIAGGIRYWFRRKTKKIEF